MGESPHTVAVAGEGLSATAAIAGERGRLLTRNTQSRLCGTGTCSLAPCGCLPHKKPSLLKAHQFEGDSFDSGSEGSEGLGPCVPPLSALIGTVAETSKEKYRLLDQRDRIMRQGMVHGGRGSGGLVRSSSWVPSEQEQLLSTRLCCC
ncbi:hypothetical protein P7K49_032351 [Saguinus oedipus]|uniref:Uncharacterized protein n=1 Tax=Saguinus oedipus TaxID=9490 RepID=A0ABQ9TYU3_SAGOE|nr:hypothetical protein P7K49_032351 [Saguinus oedipus]